jgi:hypothetical protein
MEENININTNQFQTSSSPNESNGYIQCIPNGLSDILLRSLIISTYKNSLENYHLIKNQKYSEYIKALGGNCLYEMVLSSAMFLIPHFDYGYIAGISAYGFYQDKQKGKDYKSIFLKQGSNCLILGLGLGISFIGAPVLVKGLVVSSLGYGVNKYINI